MKANSQAIVRPRVISGATGESVPLDDLICSLAEHRRRGAIEVRGASCAGKSTALSHLAAILPPSLDVAVMDDVDVGDLINVEREAERRLVVYTIRSAAHQAKGETLPLAGWGEDEWIEYLLAVHPRQCPSAIARAQDSEDKHTLRGNPLLWSVVLDEMARDESLKDTRQALRQHLRRLFDDGPLPSRQQVRAELYCMAELLGENGALHFARLTSPHLRALLSQRIVQLLIAEDFLAELILQGKHLKMLAKPLPRDLIHAVGLRVGESELAREVLRQVLEGGDTRCHPMAASLLHASGTHWTPGARVADLNLSEALLAGARWSSVDLAQSNLNRADLRDAILWKASLDGANLHAAKLRGADLSGASMVKALAWGADFDSAQLIGIRGIGLMLGGANLNSANLDDADLRLARFHASTLRGATLRRANLTRAEFGKADLKRADFLDADLTRASLEHLSLRDAEFAGACFSQAQMTACDLEWMQLPGARFDRANLRDAYLTGSEMPDACFYGAVLIGAGLSEIEWEGADLRGADLRNCSFHLGSSRSGLVGSPYPGHGSKTGFYTDDYEDQSFKAPEEIRKANLRGADLRGADIRNTDFYLVDLRAALYSHDQALHFGQCGAIL